MRERALGGAALALAALLVVSCSGGGDEEGDGGEAAGVPGATTGPTTTALPSCENARHLVVFDTNGTITGAGEVVEWLQDATDIPTPRPLAAELAAAYYERGYELLYVTGLPEDHMIGDKATPEAMMDWLVDNGFPVEGARVETSHTPDPSTELSNDLMVLGSDGVVIDAAFTDNATDVESFKVAGVQEIFLLGDANANGMATTIPGDDLAPQVARVQALPQVCAR